MFIRALAVVFLFVFLQLLCYCIFTIVYLYQNRSLVIHLQGWAETNIGRLYYIFQTEFKEYEKHIEGLRLLSYREKTFLITFHNDHTQKKDTFHRDRFHELCSKGYHCITICGDVIITTTLPQQPNDIISLYPVPFEMNEDHFQQIVGNLYWGQLMHVTYGRNRNTPKIKNGFVNLHIKDTQFNMIDSQIKAFGHWIQVTKPNERHLPLCNYCKARGHAIGECPKIQAMECALCKQKGYSALHCNKSKESSNENATMTTNNTQPSNQHKANFIDLISEQDKSIEIQKEPTEMEDHYQEAEIIPHPTQNKYAQLSDDTESDNEEEDERSSLTLADFTKEKSDQSSLRVRRKAKRRKINEKKTKQIER